MNGARWQQQNRNSKPKRLCVWKKRVVISFGAETTFSFRYWIMLTSTDKREMGSNGQFMNDILKIIRTLCFDPKRISIPFHVNRWDDDVREWKLGWLKSCIASPEIISSKVASVSRFCWLIVVLFLLRFRAKSDQRMMVGNLCSM